MLYRITVACFLYFSLLLSLPAQAEEKVMVYSREEYIPASVLEDFTKETGIKVEYFTFANDEIMYTRLKILKGRGFDVLISPSNMVNRMHTEGLIRQLHLDILKNMQGLDPLLLNKPYDRENRFSIPYLWGTTGMVLDTEVFKSEEINSWKALWDSKAQGKVLLTDDMRDVFGMALEINGYSINSSDSDEIRQAYDDLKELMPSVKVITRKPQEALMSGDVAIGQSWSADVTVAQKQRPSLQYVYPKEGSSFWVDSFVVSAKTANYEHAHTFIDYMLRPEIAARCVEQTNYATPVLAAKKLLSKEITNDPVIFPPQEAIQKAEFKTEVTRDAMNLYLILWDKLKNDK